MIPIPIGPSNKYPNENSKALVPKVGMRISKKQKPFLHFFTKKECEKTIVYSTIFYTTKKSLNVI